MDKSTNSKKVDYVLLLIVGLFILSIVSFVVVLTKLQTGNQDSNGNYIGDQIAPLSDPFSIPIVDDAKLVSATESSSVFEVSGTVLEIMAKYQLTLIDTTTWQIVEPSIEPAALNYQEIVINKGEDNSSNIRLSVETIDETKVRVTATLV
jgi:hypothetical protein